MILALDVGNSQIYCGVFDGDQLVTQFRRTSSTSSSSDELGVFLRGALRENGVDPDKISTIATCSVVPDLNYSLRACCQKYFEINPMIMRPGIKTGPASENGKVDGAPRDEKKPGAVSGSSAPALRPISACRASRRPRDVRENGNGHRRP